MSSSARSALIPISASWSGAPGNGVTASLTALVDTSSFAHNLGSVLAFNGVTYANSWWFETGTGFSGLSLTVSGSSNPASNATFGDGDINWIRIYSNSATPDLALFDPASISDIGSNSSPTAPTDSGTAGRIQVPTGGGGLGGEEMDSQGVQSTIPEPGTLALVALGGVGMLARRQFTRKR